MSVDRLSHNELGALAADAISELAASDDPAAFAELLALSQVLGQALGRSARGIAEAGSWARVADMAGTTRQAAWSRWNVVERG